MNEDIYTEQKIKQLEASMSSLCGLIDEMLKTLNIQAQNQHELISAQKGLLKNLETSLFQKTKTKQHER